MGTKKIQREDGQHVKCCLEDKKSRNLRKIILILVAESRKCSLSGDRDLNVFVNIGERAGREKDKIYNRKRKIKGIKSQKKNKRLDQKRRTASSRGRDALSS